MKILFTEDNKAMKLLLENNLEKWGYDFFSAETGEEALEIFKSEDIRFLLLDWNLPGKIQGIDLAKRINSMDLSRYIYIAMLTARKEPEDFKECLQIGVDDYIIKPFKPGELKIRILMGERILKLKQEILDLKNGLASCKIDLQQKESGSDHIKTARKIDEIINKCKEKNLSVGIAILNFNNLENIKKIYGNAPYNSIHVEILKKINSVCLKNHIVERFKPGGYAIIVPGCQIETCKMMKNRLLKILKDKDFEMDVHINMKYNASIDFMEVPLETTPSGEDILNNYH